MKYTRFGELMRILRIQNHEVMGDIADILNVKPSFLSAVETGKKNVPSEWIEILSKHYNLTDEEKSKMIDAIELSKTQIKVDLSGENNYKREMALIFQRSFNNIDEETSKRIIQLLNNKEDN